MCELDGVLIASRAIAAAFAIFIGSVCAAQGNPEDALSEYQKSVDRIASFDVSIDEETVFVLKGVVTSTRLLRGREVPQIEYVPYEEGTPPATRTAMSRQVWERSGRQRSEYTSGNAPENSDQVFDGSVVRVLGSTTGRVHDTPPAKRPLLVVSHRYDALFRELFFGGTYSELFSSRQQIVISAMGDAGDLLIDSPPQPGNMYPEFGFRLTLDAAHGFLPKQIEVRRGDELNYVCRILAFSRTKDGAWVPISSTTDFYGRDAESQVAVLSTTKLTVDLNHSSWNEPIDEELFTLSFPAGTRVRDEVRGTEFIAGAEE